MLRLFFAPGPRASLLVLYAFTYGTNLKWGCEKYFQNAEKALDMRRGGANVWNSSESISFRLHAVKQYAEDIHRRRRIPDQRPEKGERLCQCS
jgi:hypothetical protein